MTRKETTTLLAAALDVLPPRPPLWPATALPGRRGGQVVSLPWSRNWKKRAVRRVLDGLDMSWCLDIWMLEDACMVVRWSWCLWWVWWCTDKLSNKFDLPALGLEGCQVPSHRLLVNVSIVCTFHHVLLLLMDHQPGMPSGPFCRQENTSGLQPDSLPENWHALWPTLVVITMDLCFESI